MRILLIDDMRNWKNLADLGFDFSSDMHKVIARSYNEGINYLKSSRWDVLYLDHDLGCKKTGYDVLCWLEENQEFLPGYIIFVTSNPVGRQRMQQVKEKLYQKDLTNHD